MATTRSNRHRDEPDDLRRKLALLEGDRKAYYESSQETIHQNKNMITALRKENNAMASRIKSEKRGASVDQQAEVRKLRHTIHEMIAKHNILRHQCEGKERALAKVEREVRILESETAALEQAAAGSAR